jgi:hypothetical protein
MIYDMGHNEIHRARGFEAAVRCRSAPICR